MTNSTVQGRAADGDPREEVREARPEEGLSLRQEDLQVGRRFVHPETRLEYADFHAYLCDKDPLPHWRNARVKEVLAKGRTGYVRLDDHVRSSYIDGQAWLDSLFRHYDRDGQPYVAARTDEHGLSFTT